MLLNTDKYLARTFSSNVALATLVLTSEKCGNLVIVGKGGAVEVVGKACG